MTIIIYSAFAFDYLKSVKATLLWDLEATVLQNKL